MLHIAQPEITPAVVERLSQAENRGYTLPSNLPNPNHSPFFYLPTRHLEMLTYLSNSYPKKLISVLNLYTNLSYGKSILSRTLSA